MDVEDVGPSHIGSPLPRPLSRLPAASRAPLHYQEYLPPAPVALGPTRLSYSSQPERSRAYCSMRIPQDRRTTPSTGFASGLGRPPVLGF